METEADSHWIVFQSPQVNACRDMNLVLQAAGISSEVLRGDSGWLIRVRSKDRDFAIAELDAYRQDSHSLASAAVDRVPIFGGSITGVIYYLLVVVSVFVLADLHAYEFDWLFSGRMRAGDVRSGQLWRTVTALTLHSDLSHLLSNLAFGGVFGWMAGRILGGGIAWLSILLGGALGNLLNAWMRDGDHTSIGASTAVFAALGIMVTHTISLKPVVDPSAMKRWSPLIAGVVLLALIGVGGERTDVGAHFTGFLAGLAVGWIACRTPRHWLDNWYAQLLAGSVSVMMVIISWIAAASSVSHPTNAEFQPQLPGAAQSSATKSTPSAKDVSAVPNAVPLENCLLLDH